MWCVVARLLLSRLIISSIRARCFFTHFGQEPSGLTAAGRGEAASLPAITDGKRRFEKKEDKHEKETDPRPSVHWYLLDNSGLVVSTICLSAPEHTRQLVLNTLCVFSYAKTAVLSWLWATKKIIRVLLWMFNYMRASGGAFSFLDVFTRTLARRRVILSKMLMIVLLFH